MKCRKSLIMLVAASSFGIAPVTHAIDLGNFNDTSFSIGGFLKAEGIFENPENGDSRIFGRANQSRFNLKTVTEKQGHTVVGFIEGDFYGGLYPGENNDWRLRHAFIKIDNTTIGQTWTGQFWAVAFTDYLDFFGGPRGTLAGNNFRTTLASYQFQGLRVTAQDPVYADADTPDLAINYDLNLDGGHKIILTASGREVDNGDFVAGGAIGTKVMLGRHSLNLNAHYGEGLGAFTGVGVNGSLSDELENGDAVSQAGLNAGFRYVFNDQWRANVSYTKVEVDDQAETNYESSRMNLIHNILPELEVGVEWRKYNLAFGPLAPEGQQVEVMAKYAF
ncbi:MULTISPECIES: porin [Marinobacter]|uniref:porin n=1 Tax=Marinobacter TaxID=2742 RepID=UPI0012453A05|nr:MULTISPECIES: porin [Marinobacter]MBL3558742.1 porin [Marinobacter sp. JB05H06]